MGDTLKTKNKSGKKSRHNMSAPAWFDHIENGDIFDQNDNANHIRYTEWAGNNPDELNKFQMKSSTQEDQDQNHTFISQKEVVHIMTDVTESEDLGKDGNTWAIHSNSNGQSLKHNDSILNMELDASNENRTQQTIDDGKRTSIERTPVIPYTDSDDVENHGTTNAVNEFSGWVEIDLHSESGSEEGESTEICSRPPNPAVAPDVNSSSQASCISAYFDLLYYIGLSLSKSDGTNKRGMIQFGLFGLVTSIALIQPMIYVKDTLAFGDKDYSVPLYFINLGYRILTFLARLCFSYVMTVKLQKMREFIKSIIELHGWSSKQMIALVVGLPTLASCIISVAQPMLETIARMQMHGEWDFEDLILKRSFQLAQTIFVWDREDLEHKRDFLRDTYEENVTSTTIAMGVSDLSISTIAILYNNLILDACIVSAFSICNLCNNLEKQLRSSSVPPTPDASNDLWKEYQQVRHISNMLNECLWLFFPIFDFYNLLFCAYFLFKHVILGTHMILVIPGSVIILKLIVFYLLAAKASSINPQLNNWVQASFRGVYTSIIENGEAVTTESIFKEIKSNPIGLGKNMFFIDESFIWKIPRAVGAYFFFFSESADDM